MKWIVGVKWEVDYGGMGWKYDHIWEASDKGGSKKLWFYERNRSRCAMCFPLLGSDEMKVLEEEVGNHGRYQAGGGQE